MLGDAAGQDKNAIALGYAQSVQNIREAIRFFVQFAIGEIQHRFSFAEPPQCHMLRARSDSVAVYRSWAMLIPWLPGSPSSSLHASSHEKLAHAWA